VHHEVESLTVDEAAETTDPGGKPKKCALLRDAKLYFLPDTFTFARNDCHALTELVLAEFTAKARNS